MTSRLPAQCLSCAHWESPLDRDDEEADPTQTCTAFPKGIPEEIWWNRADHRKPFEGDRGIRWEARDDPRGGKRKFPERAMNVPA